MVSVCWPNVGLFSEGSRGEDCQIEIEEGEKAANLINGVARGEIEINPSQSSFSLFFRCGREGSRSRVPTNVSASTRLCAFPRKVAVGVARGLGRQLPLLPTPPRRLGGRT